MNKLENYDGNIYRRDDFRTQLGLCLRFQSGSFHFSDEIVRVALDAGWKIYQPVRKYTPMPWGMQHIGYDYVECD
jgi:hypothetical protein